MHRLLSKRTSVNSDSTAEDNLPYINHNIFFLRECRISTYVFGRDEDSSGVNLRTWRAGLARGSRVPGYVSHLRFSRKAGDVPDPDCSGLGRIRVAAGQLAGRRGVLVLAASGETAVATALWRAYGCEYNGRC